LTAKVNVQIELLGTINGFTVELWDVDAIKDDLLGSQPILKAGHFEFLFDTNVSGEFRPELQLRVVDAEGNEVFKSEINDSLSSLAIDENTGRIENTTIDFGVIQLV
jgi:hypothetical protein